MLKTGDLDIYGLASFFSPLALANGQVPVMHTDIAWPIERIGRCCLAKLKLWPVSDLALAGEGGGGRGVVGNN